MRKQTNICVRGYNLWELRDEHHDAFLFYRNLDLCKAIELTPVPAQASRHLSGYVHGIYLSGYGEIKAVKLLEYYKQLAQKFPIEQDYILVNLNFRLKEYSLTNHSILIKKITRQRFRKRNGIRSGNSITVFNRTNKKSPINFYRGFFYYRF